MHPGREWFTVLSGTIRLYLGDRVMLVAAGDAAEFTTMVPDSLGAAGGPAEILTIFAQDGERAHMPTPGRGGANDPDGTRALRRRRS